jgi:TPR repeat protein
MEIAPFGGVKRSLVALLFACSAAAFGAPADDHQRGLTAFQRGDLIGAMAALRPAAKAGHAPSQALLAFILDRADFLEESTALYRAAAEQNDPEGHAGIAGYYLVGRGVAKDEKRAIEHFSKAAELGHGGAIEILATAWTQGTLGLDAKADPAAARAALLRAAERKHLPSADALAEGHQSGRYGLPVDAAEAARWKAAAAQWRRERAASAPAGGARR